MAQLVKAPSAEPDDPSSIPENSSGGKREPALASCPPTSICMHRCTCVCAHMH